MTPVFRCPSMTLKVSLLAAGDTTLSFDYLLTGRLSETFLEFTSSLELAMIISTFILRRSHDTFVLLFLLDMMAFYNPIFNHTIFTGSAGTVLPVRKA